MTTMRINRVAACAFQTFAGKLVEYTLDVCPLGRIVSREAEILPVPV
jgi:hypothetical protein